jgi:hypothetical protein
MDDSASVLADISNHFSLHPPASSATPPATPPPGDETSFNDLSMALSLLDRRSLDSPSHRAPKPSVSPANVPPSSRSHPNHHPNHHPNPHPTTTELSASLHSPEHDQHTRHLANISLQAMSESQDLLSRNETLSSQQRSLEVRVEELSSQSSIYARTLKAFQDENVRLTGALNHLSGQHQDALRANADLSESLVKMEAKIGENKFLDKHESKRIKAAMEGMAEENVRMRQNAEKYRDQYEETASHSLKLEGTVASLTTQLEHATESFSAVQAENSRLSSVERELFMSSVARDSAVAEAATLKVRCASERPSCSL